MARVAGGRYCSSCKTRVHDLTRMTATQAHAYALLFGGPGLCGRLLSDADGAARFRPSSGRSRGFSSVPLAIVAAAGTACSPTPPPAKSAEACKPTATIVTAAPEPPATLPGEPSAAATDSDNDGIVESADACPRDPGTVANGGCPELRRVIVATTGALMILEHLMFERSAISPRPGSVPVLEELAKLLREHPEITLVSVEGHADVTEPNGEAISRNRAKAVIEALVKRGVERTRLSPIGLAASKPLDEGKGPAALQRNRRVELRIVETPTR